MGIFGNIMSKFFKPTKNTKPQTQAAVQPVNAQPETVKSHTKVFKVAGVTFENRQKYLKMLMDLKLKGGRLDIALSQYDFKGEPAIDIVVNGLNIGNFHTEDKAFVLENQERVFGIKDLYINSFINENNKTVYYAKIKLIVANKVKH